MVSSIREINFWFSDISHLKLYISFVTLILTHSSWGLYLCDAAISGEITSVRSD